MQNTQRCNKTCDFAPYGAGAARLRTRGTGTGRLEPYKSIGLRKFQPISGMAAERAISATPKVIFAINRMRERIRGDCHDRQSPP